MYNLRYIWRNYPVITIGLAAINIIVFLYTDLTAGTWDTEAMIRFGAQYHPLIVEGGEYYRLLTACFLHFGVEHLMGNMLSLGVLGYRLEAILGHVRYLILYLLTGIGANIVSLVWDQFSGIWYVSAGASGAVFGIVGALFVILRKYRGAVDGVGWREMAIAVIVMVVTSGMDSSVDYVAHGACLVLGILIGLILVLIPKRKKQWN